MVSTLVPASRLMRMPPTGTPALSPPSLAARIMPGPPPVHTALPSSAATCQVPVKRVAR